MTLMKPIPPAATITCTVADLRRVVTAAASVVARRNTIPVISCLRIIPHDGALEVEGTNLDAWLSVRCDATCTPGAAILVEARLMRAVLAGAAADETVSIDRDADILTVRIGSTTMRLRQLISAADWPEAPNVKDMAYTEITETTLAKLIDNTIWAVSTDMTRYYLNGIYLHARNGAMAAAATDGYRLAVYQSHDAWPLPDLIFPRDLLRPLRRLLTAGGNRAVRIGGRAGSPTMALRGDDWSMVAKCVDGKYPDYSRVIPDRSIMRGHAVIGRDPLRILTDISAITPMGTAIKLDLFARSASMAAGGMGLDVAVPITADGDFAIGINQRYLREVVRLFGTVRIEASAPRDPAMLLTEDPDLTVVLMPMWVS